MAYVGHRSDVVLDQRIGSRFECAHVHHHVDLARAIVDGLSSLEGLHLRQGCPQGKAHYRADHHLRALQGPGALRHVTRVDAHRGEMVFPRLSAQFVDHVGGNVCSEQGVVDQGGQLGRLELRGRGLARARAQTLEGLHFYAHRKMSVGDTSLPNGRLCAWHVIPSQLFRLPTYARGVCFSISWCKSMRGNGAGSNSWREVSQASLDVSAMRMGISSTNSLMT